jgi:hypothetical protein
MHGMPCSTLPLHSTLNRAWRAGQFCLVRAASEELQWSLPWDSHPGLHCTVGAAGGGPAAAAGQPLVLHHGRHLRGPGRLHEVDSGVRSTATCSALGITCFPWHTSPCSASQPTTCTAAPLKPHQLPSLQVGVMRKVPPSTLGAPNGGFWALQVHPNIPRRHLPAGAAALPERPHRRPHQARAQLPHLRRRVHRRRHPGLRTMMRA